MKASESKLWKESNDTRTGFIKQCTHLAVTDYVLLNVQNN